MEIDFKQLNDVVNDIHILPGINDLVNVIYNDHLNSLLDKKNESLDDRRVLLMFLIMYFYSYLSIPKDIKNHIDVKQTLKAFLSELIKDHKKRKVCLEMYQAFETTVKTIGINNININNNIKEITDKIEKNSN